MSPAVTEIRPAPRARVPPSERGRVKRAKRVIKGKRRGRRKNKDGNYDEKRGGSEIYVSVRLCFLNEPRCTSTNKGCKIPKTFTTYPPSLCLSFAYPLNSTLDLKDRCSCERKTRRTESGRAGDRERSREKRDYRKRQKEDARLLSTRREVALCPTKIVSGTREKAHNVCKRLDGTNCKSPGRVNPC